LSLRISVRDAGAGGAACRTGHCRWHCGGGYLQSWTNPLGATGSMRAHVGRERVDSGKSSAMALSRVLW